MFFLSILVAIIIVFGIASHLYTKYTFINVEYQTAFSATEVFENEDIFLYEEISNNKTLPLPCVRVDTELPEGLRFVLRRREDAAVAVRKAEPRRKKRGPVTSRSLKSQREAEKPEAEEYLRGYVQNIFSLHSYRKITRRWRVTCERRGVYSIGGTRLVSTDPLGFFTQSKRIEAPSGKRATITVLPKPLDLSKFFAATPQPTGERTAPRGLVSDPLRIAGSREYTPLDPMNKINWKSTAVHGKLMVNVEEYAEENRFGLILNMQSRSHEQNPKTPSDPQSVELCISVCATIFDMMSVGSVPVRLIANAPPEEAELGEDHTIMIGDSPVIRTREFIGRGDMIEALRLLSVLPMKISCPIEKLLDAVAEDPLWYAEGGNLIIVSPFVDERMINFHAAMKKAGVRVIFFVTGTSKNAPIIPEDVEIWFRTYR